jgi:formate-nitrite transporter family protein
MAEALKPDEIFDRAADEGQRRLDQSWLELVSTGFIAGFTVVFGIIAMGIVEGLSRPSVGEMSKLLGALAFAPAIAFLVVGRAELFSENFFDPVAAAFKHRQRGLLSRLMRLWVVTLALNLVGGALLVAVLSVEGALPVGAIDGLTRVSEEIVGRSPLATFARAIIGGALVALLSFLTIAADHSGARITLAFLVGFLLALGPFDHVVVSALHTGFGLSLGATIGWLSALEVTAIAILGNLLGGVGLVTLSHAAQVRGGEERP